MDQLEGLEQDRTGDRFSERFEVSERVSVADTDRGNERSPPTLEIEPLYRNLLHSPVVSRLHSSLQPYHLTSSSPPPHTMDTSNARFRPVPVTAQTEMTSTYGGHPRQTWPVMAKQNITSVHPDWCPLITTLCCPVTT